MNKLYFPNLNALRFLAAFLVIVNHVEQFRNSMGLPNVLGRIELVGRFGVTSFFVLSGYLITYLLLVEKEKTNTISIPKFYFRRILRIWPVYYLVIIATFALLPVFPFFSVGGLDSELKQNFLLKLGFNLFFIPNFLLFVNNAGGIFPYASQAWSVGVEEQFYFIWPWVIKKVSNVKRMLIWSFATFYIIMFIIKLACHRFPQFVFTQKMLLFWSYSFNVDCMIVGAFFALMLYNGKVPKILYNKWLFMTAVLLVFIAVAYQIFLPLINLTHITILMGYIILYLSSSGTMIFENKILNYLGRISYGIYMYHGYAIVLAYKAVAGMGKAMYPLQYLLTIGITLLLSALSYTFFERFFIRKKEIFQNVKSSS